MSRRDFFLIAFISTGLILAFPPFPMGFIAAVVLVPFFFYLEGKNLGKAFRGGYAVGLLWAAGTIYWIGWATVLGLLGSLLIVPLYFALFAVIQAWLWKEWGEVSIFIAPLVWTFVELLSSYGALAFPWNKLAYTLTYHPLLIQYASITGVYGVTFWVVMLNVFFFFCLRNIGRWRRLIVFLAIIFFLLILPYIHGRWVLSKESKHVDRIRLTLVQGNIDPYKKWTPSFSDSNFAVYRQLTWRAKDQNPEMIVWPETATACYLRHRPSYLYPVKSQIDSMDIPLLTGSPDYEWTDAGRVKKYNGALFFHPFSQRIGRYYKMHLVPFSERVPLADKVPFLYNLSKNLDLDIGDFSPGDSVVVFKFTPSSMQKSVYFSVVICYESIFPYLVREFIRRGAQFLVVITNDGWFGRTSGPYQHAQIAVFRAIENRVWVARCANTGISEFIDPFGRIRAKTGLNEEAILTYSISLNSKKTFFTNYGSVFPIFIFIMNGFVLVATVMRTRNQRANGLQSVEKPETYQ